MIPKPKQSCAISGVVLIMMALLSTSILADAQTFVDVLLNPCDVLTLKVIRDGDSYRVTQFLSNDGCTQAQPLTAVYKGRDADKVGPQTIGANGTLDHHIALANLKSTPTQISVSANNGGIWVSPFNIAHWLILPQYSGNGADLWFEKFSNESSFTVQVWYADGTTDSVAAN